MRALVATEKIALDEAIDREGGWFTRAGEAAPIGRGVRGDRSAGAA